MKTVWIWEVYFVPISVWCGSLLAILLLSLLSVHGSLEKEVFHLKGLFPFTTSSPTIALSLCFKPIQLPLMQKLRQKLSSFVKSWDNKPSKHMCWAFRSRKLCFVKPQEQPVLSRTTTGSGWSWNSQAGQDVRLKLHQRKFIIKAN